jgi:hypothetical protein
MGTGVLSPGVIGQASCLIKHKHSITCTITLPYLILLSNSVKHGSSCDVIVTQLLEISHLLLNLMVQCCVLQEPIALLYPGLVVSNPLASHRNIVHPSACKWPKWPLTFKLLYRHFSACLISHKCLMTYPFHPWFEWTPQENFVESAN